MVDPETHSNRVVGRGRDIITSGVRRKPRPPYEMSRKCWPSCPRIGNPPLGKPKVKFNLSSDNDSRKLQALILFFCIVTSSGAEGYSHQPFKWSLIRWEDQYVIQTKITSGAPSFLCTLCDLIPVNPCLNQFGYYFCPSSNPGKGYCNYPGHFYCAYWDCVSVSSFGGNEDEFIRTGWGPYGCTQPTSTYTQKQGGLDGTCNMIYINVTNPHDQVWLLGKMWGARLWEPGIDRGGHFMIQKTTVPHDPEPIGPNQAIAGELMLEENNGNESETAPTTSLPEMYKQNFTDSTRRPENPGEGDL
uniref:endogenous retrovirus group S71 member 1 Env polyprotein-like n=1 Tax=Agelaius phoeniceus TaxID=39638 RepID=UPI0023ED2746|nr:endogenous retrovirus group S71 member 1 Env polyprotein-like [Agelaius phoeniceus]XP_054496218.1 endogenous retrovirus group S71 member 1 Env polyprotein-like [Agelaius phoeniceus]XP_054496220.1 endogenous retrovirus group S71 member 1 Env polyprotein-like [Agelaius phoeniceus]XP_054496221.1 endogenous retrovirus group S71 member 1 Env polyprotein-like [Agelaius phoeniceus]